MGSKEYISVLENTVKPWLDVNYPEGNYVWQQDGAPGHTPNATQNWCKENLADFWPKHLWPASSPDLNPLEFSIWSIVEAAACATPHPSVTALKASVDLH